MKKKSLIPEGCKMRSIVKETRNDRRYGVDIAAMHERTGDEWVEKSKRELLNAWTLCEDIDPAQGEVTPQNIEDLIRAGKAVQLGNLFVSNAIANYKGAITEYSEKENIAGVFRSYLKIITAAPKNEKSRHISDAINFHLRNFSASQLDENTQGLVRKIYER